MHEHDSLSARHTSDSWLTRGGGHRYSENDKLRSVNRTSDNHPKTKKPAGFLLNVF